MNKVICICYKYRIKHNSGYFDIEIMEAFQALNVQAIVECIYILNLQDRADSLGQRKVLDLQKKEKENKDKKERSSHYLYKQGKGAFAPIYNI